VLLHDPEFLMLDEPTLGLDPAGVAEMREIFRSLNARDVTLLFSSHQLAEMERVCDRIILMNGGQVVAAGRQEELISEAQRKRMISVETAEDARDWLDGINEKPGVRSAMIDGDGRVVLTLDDFVGISETVRRAQASRIVTDCGLTVLNVTAGTPSLEELFLQLTARDDTAGNLGG
jgi:ABC-2 type transport system ATP-binding protein